MTLTNIDDLERPDGVPLDLGEGRTVWVRKAGGENRLFAYTMSRVLEEKADGDYDSLTPEQRVAVELEIYSRCIVSGWEGFSDEAGPAKCSPDHVRELFERSPAAFSKVRALAEDEEAHRLPRDTKSAG